MKNCLLSYAWKSFHSNNPTAIDELINKGSERSLNKIMKNYNSTSIRYMSPIFHMTRYWNDLPLEIKRSESLKSFQNKVKNLALNKYRSGAAKPAPSLAEFLLKPAVFLAPISLFSL